MSYTRFNLSQFLISDVDECQSSPCKNGGTCLNQQAGYSCKCKDGYSGEHCEEGNAYIYMKIITDLFVIVSRYYLRN